METTTFEKAQILEDLVAMLEDMTSDWDTEYDEGITLQTRLIGDLEFESIDVVQFILDIEERYQRRKLPFEKLIMRDGRYVDEILVGDAVDFLHQELNRPVA
jgi:acyl carrier protein